jgi:hypothetical protein
VSEEEFERFPERITAHFHRVREALDEARDGEGRPSDQS